MELLHIIHAESENRGQHAVAASGDPATVCPRMLLFCEKYHNKSTGLSGDVFSVGLLGADLSTRLLIDRLCDAIIAGVAVVSHREQRKQPAVD